MMFSAALQVTFLRQMEQEEWQSRPFLERGSVTRDMRKWKGNLGGEDSGARIWFVRVG